MSTVRKVLSVCEAGAPLSEWLTEARRGGRALLILGEQGAARSCASCSALPSRRASRSPRLGVAGTPPNRHTCP
jgi:hypothetical protein